jgi:cobalt/nickel transport system permease protein
MHMADALLSPAVGGVMWGATAVLTSISARKVARSLDDRRVPLMGVLGAFIFAAQMINFSIPGTGSSGHLGGGMILAVLLGPHAAFLTISSVLIVQALFFADGGVLALGCNIFNLGFFPCFIAYPLVYRAIVGESLERRRLMTGAIAASVAGLLLGATAVVIQTGASGISALPLGRFLLLMLPIHLAIGIVEGIVTAAVVLFVSQARPEILDLAAATRRAQRWAFGNVMAVLLAVALATGGILSWFASGDPDGLEWSLARATGQEELAGPEAGLHAALAGMQEKTALLPDYDLPAGESAAATESAAHTASTIVQPGTSLAGLVGALLTLALAGLIGYALRWRRAAV